MRRNNPITNLPFKHGDTREDGYRFFRYTNQVKSNGTFKEIWLHPDSFAKSQADVAAHQAKTYVRKTSRLPKGWAAQLRDPVKVKVCRWMWQELFNASEADKEFLDMEWVYDNGRWDSVRDLLMPYAYDYNGH